jgi:hypothetical protein
MFRGGWFVQDSGASRRGNVELYLVVIASEAQQSILFLCAMDCFASLAMTGNIFENKDCRVHTDTLVMPGLDPGIHPSSQEFFRRRWIAGSSPAMTS